MRRILLGTAAFLALSAHATVVPSPPSGSREIGVLVCPRDPSCVEEQFFADRDPRYLSLPIVLVDSLLAHDVATVAAGESAGIAFAEALSRARGEYAAGRWEPTEFALDDALGALNRWRGAPAQQDLFDTYFLRGAVSVAQGFGGAERFQQAVATAWNRPVVVPGIESVARAYADALAAAVAEVPGKVSVTGPGVVSLNGVELGPPPIRVDVLPGTHRLTAREGDREWRGDVVVAAGRTVEARVRFASAEDEREVTATFAALVERRVLRPELGDLVARWAATHEVRRVRFVIAGWEAPAEVLTGGAEPPVETPPVMTPTFVEFTYDPALRRFGG